MHWADKEHLTCDHSVLSLTDTYLANSGTEIVYTKAVQSIVFMLPKAYYMSFFHIERFVHYIIITLIIYSPLQTHLALCLNKSF